MRVIKIFFGTRIQINVSWYGSGQMIRIRIRNTDILYRKILRKYFFFGFRSNPVLLLFHEVFYRKRAEMLQN